MKIMKRSEDIGSPCLIPLEGLKDGVCVLLTRIAKELLKTQDIMSLLILLVNLKKNKDSLMKDNSSLSKAFSRLFFRAMLGFLPLILIM